LNEDGEADENIDPQSKYLWKSHLRIIPAAIFLMSQAMMVNCCVRHPKV
jgi:hypothetical protein